MKFLSRLFTALNLLPSIATLAFESRPICAAQLDEPRTHLLDGAAVVLAEVRNRLVVGRQPTEQPHHLDVAPSFAFQPPARLHPVEIAVDVELQQSRRMIGRPSGRRRLDAVEPQLGRSSASTNASITRTGLLSSTQSSRHSGNSVDCARSAPAMKRFINPPANHEENHSSERRFHTWGNSGSEPHQGTANQLSRKR